MFASSPEVNGCTWFLSGSSRSGPFANIGILAPPARLHFQFASSPHFRRPPDLYGMIRVELQRASVCGLGCLNCFSGKLSPPFRNAGPYLCSQPPVPLGSLNSRSKTVFVGCTLPWSLKSRAVGPKSGHHVPQPDGRGPICFAIVSCPRCGGHTTDISPKRLSVEYDIETEFFAILDMMAFRAWSSRKAAREEKKI